MKERNEQSTVCYKLKFRLLLLIVLNWCVKLRNEAVISKNKICQDGDNIQIQLSPRNIHKMRTKLMYYQSVMESDCNTKETLKYHRLVQSIYLLEYKHVSILLLIMLW